MKIVVIGGTGLIGRQLVNDLGKRGHEVIAASPSSGVDSITGEGLEGSAHGRTGRRGREQCALLCR